MSQRIPSEDLPPTVAIVYKELSTNAPITQKDLIEATNLPFRSVHVAVERLKDLNAVQELVYSNGHLKLYLFNRELQETETVEGVSAL